MSKKYCINVGVCIINDPDLYDSDYETSYGGGTNRVASEEFGFYHQNYTLDEIVREPWFLELLKEKGFYTKDEVYDGNLDHLDKFVYKVKNDYWSGQLVDSLNRIGTDTTVIGVYQEVVGPERIKEVKRLNAANEKAKRDAALAEKEKAKKKAERLLRKEQKKIEEAKKLLESYNANSK